MDVRLHIERLVLDGLDVTPAQRTTLARALEGELGRLISAGGVSGELVAGLSVPSMQAGASRVGAPFDPVGFGHEIARALYGGIGGRGR